MKNFIEVTCFNEVKKQEYKRLVNMAYVLDVKPISEQPCKSLICFAPQDRYEDSHKYRISVLETYEQIKNLAEFRPR